MVWVIIFGGIALGGAIMVVGYAIWLAHKASDVFAELTVLADRGGKIADLMGEIGAPTTAGSLTSGRISAGRIVESEPIADDVR